VWGLDSKNVWAGGSNGTILKWDGTTWAVQSTGGLTYTVVDVWGSSATNLWAVAEASRLLKWNGAGWTMVSMGLFSFKQIRGTDANNLWALAGASEILKLNPATGQFELHKAAKLELSQLYVADANTVYVAGGHSVLPATGVVLKWDGTAWTEEPSGLSQMLYAVWGTGPKNVWVGGMAGALLQYAP
jgi:hypothetical protein